MDKNSAQIYFGYNYIKNIKNLNWKDIFFGFKYHYLNKLDVENYAIDKLNNDVNDQTALQVLIDIDNFIFNKVDNYICDKDTIEIYEKYLYLTIKYIYTNKNQFEDPFNEMDEAVYEFGNPIQIKEFTQYIPQSDVRFNWSSDKVKKYRADGISEYLKKMKQKYEK